MSSKKLVRVETKDELTSHLLSLYCEGRSFIWNMFFGWRKTSYEKGYPVYTYVVPRSISELCKTIAKNYS